MKSYIIGDLKKNYCGISFVLGGVWLRIKVWFIDWGKWIK